MRRRRPVGTALAAVVLIAVPLLPGVIASGSAIGLLRLPVEAPIVVLLLALLPWRAARAAVAAAFGAVETLALLLGSVDAAYESVLAVHFDPADWRQLGDAFGVLRDAVGTAPASAVLALAGALALATAVALALASLRVAAAVRGRAGVRVPVAVIAAWAALALTGAQLTPGLPLAAAASVDSIAAAARTAATGLDAQSALPAEIRRDDWAHRPASQLLTALRGKDVLIVFVESYGRVAVEGSPFSSGVDAVLQQGRTRLAADGYGARSAWLTSPTFGGLSWLAHSTLQSGLWIDRQSLYDRVVRTDRFTLSDAFARAGWRTVADVPSNERPWPEGRSFYHYAGLLGATDVGYRGPRFGYARIPDQWTLRHFADTKLAGRHRPVMAEIDLVSSHNPWAPLPRIVPWAALGDGSVYDGQPARSESAAQVWRDPRAVQAFYARSIRYSLESMLAFLHEVHDPDLVVVLLGDHQPATVVSGTDAGHDVPVSIIARDPAVLAAVRPWHWTDGLQPAPDAPDWRMDRFRDRFLSAFR
ncbi:MAG: CDP-alcohol phosphatidyltransferase [Amnibacterium sp.]